MSKFKGVIQVVVALILIRLLIRIFLPYLAITMRLIFGSMKRIIIFILVGYVIYSMFSKSKK